jgi:hypothetical protein
MLELIKKIKEVKGSPVKIQFGYTINNKCYHDGIVILDSNTSVIDVVTAFKCLYKGMMTVSMNEENKGLLIVMY